MVYITTSKAYDFNDLLRAEFNQLEHQILVHIKIFSLDHIFMQQITGHFNRKIDTSLEDVAEYIRTYGKNLLLTDTMSYRIENISVLINVFKDIGVNSNIIAFLEYVEHIDSNIKDKFFNALTTEHDCLCDILRYLEEYFVYGKIMERMKKELKYY